MPGRQNQDYSIGNHYVNLITVNQAVNGTVNVTDQTNPVGAGIIVGINVTVITTATLTVNIQGKDEMSGQYYTLLASAALAAVAFSTLTLYPGAVVTANVSANGMLPNTYRLQAVLGGAATQANATIGASIGII